MPLQAPVEQGPVSAPESGGNSGDTHSGGKESAPSPVFETVANVGAGNDTGTTPQGGIQAGGGGTADGGVSALLLGTGALALLLTAGGLVLRRRSLES